MSESILCDILLKTSPDDVELLGLSARCQNAMGEYPAASESLRLAIKNDPARLEFYSRLATLLHERLNHAAQALSILNDMVAKNAGNQRAYVLRGEFRLAHPYVTLAKAASHEQPRENQAKKESPPLFPQTQAAQQEAAQQEENSLAAAVQDVREALKINDPLAG